MVNPMIPIHEMNGILPIRKGDGSADMGCWRKQKPSGNSSDRGCYDVFIAEDTHLEREQTSSRSKEGKGFLKSSINHCVDTGAS